MSARRTSSLDPEAWNPQPRLPPVPFLELRQRFVQVPPQYPMEIWGEHPTHLEKPGVTGVGALVPSACARYAGSRPGEDGARALHVTRPAAATHRTRLSRGLSPAPSPAEAGAGASLWRVTRRSWSHNYERLGFCC